MSKNNVSTSVISRAIGSITDSAFLILGLIDNPTGEWMFTTRDFSKENR